MILATGLLACCLAVEAPRAVVDQLQQVAGAEPAEVVRRLAEAAHPLLQVCRGQARLRLEQTAAAEADFRAALAGDGSLRAAHLGLAQCLAARSEWHAASRSAAAGLDLDTADATQVAFVAGLALRAEDWRLAALAAQHGILRFPDDDRLRRIELAVLVHAGRAEEARQAALALVERAPGEADLWRQLAWAAQETGRDDDAVAALEAALLLTPTDVTLRQRLAAGQLERGWAAAALATVRPLLVDPALAGDAVVVLASRIAAEAGELAQARAWLAAVPAAARSRTQRIQAARLAVQAGDTADAAQNLDTLIASGERDPVVLTWAGSLAEAAGDLGRAEALYRDAGEQPAATLRLAGVYLRQGRRAEATRVLDGHLLRHPDDAQAQALRDLVGAPAHLVGAPAPLVGAPAPSPAQAR